MRAGLTSLVLLASLLPAQALAQADSPQVLSARTFEIASKLRCPVCVSESVAQSSSPTSVQMRQIIEEQLAAGRSESQILTYFQERYGDWILLDPPKRGLHLLVWLLPAVAATFGVIVLAVLMRRWLRVGREPIDVDDEELQRVRRAMAERK